MAQVRRMLRAFERKPGDGLLGEWPIQCLSLADLQAMFGVEIDDPMYECYPVTETHVAALSAATGTNLDVMAYDSFVEADAV
jgi:hypothetical protein